MAKINFRSLRGSALLLAATVIWGNAFVAQSVGMDSMGPFTFQGIRCLLAVLFLFPAGLLMDIPGKGLKTALRSWADPALWKAGIICGLALFAAASLQQIGLVDTDTGKAGFITAMYIVIVPLLGFFFNRRPGINAFIGVGAAVAGLYLLSCFGVSHVNKSDWLLLGCALFFSVQILLVDRLAPALSGVHLNCIQALVTSLLSFFFMGITKETPEPAAILSCWLPLCFAGILSMGAAYTLQIEGQKLVEPTAASLLMSTESVFAAISGWLILGQRMSTAELSGCALVFLGILISQLPAGHKGCRKGANYDHTF